MIVECKIEMYEKLCFHLLQREKCNFNNLKDNCFFMTQLIISSIELCERKTKTDKAETQ